MRPLDCGTFTIDLSGLASRAGGPKLDPTDGTAVAVIESADRQLRDKFAKGSIGFYDWPVQAQTEDLAAMRETAMRLRKEYEGAVVFGIGGSYLGPATIQQALLGAEEEGAFPIHWVVNVDPPAIERARHFMKKRKTAAVVISKSGNTTETLSGFFHFARGLDAKGIIAITDPEKGELRRLATENRWTSFPVPPAIGGRFSVLTAVGLFPTWLAGLPAEKLLEGAAALRSRFEDAPAAENPAYLLSYLKYLWDSRHGHHVQYLMPYRSNLEKLAAWYVQLWGESLGKYQKGTNRPVGPTPGTALGTSDQHSLLQLFKEGPRNKVIGFVDVPEVAGGTAIGTPPFPVKDNAYLAPHAFDAITSRASRAVEKSLANSGVPTYRIELPRVDAAALGALFFFFETACGLAGELYGVDAYNQPGVEEAKKLLRESL